MFVQWASFYCFLIAAIIHIGFFVYEAFLMKGPKEVLLWAKNQAVYNLCVALGTLVGLYFVLKLQIQVAGVVIGLFGITMVAAGVTLWFTVPRLRKFAYLQAGPPILGFLFLVLHILDRV